MKTYLSKIVPVITCFLMIITQVSGASDHCSVITKGDTTILGYETLLDSINFYLSRESNRADYTAKDTLIFVDSTTNRVFKIPYKITSTATTNAYLGAKYFRMTGLFLQQDSLDYYLHDLFSYPLEKLKDSIGAVDWKNHPIYLTYFEPYDTKSEFRSTGSRQISEDEGSTSDFDQWKQQGGNNYVEQNYSDFPLPQTIDLEVDLRKYPRVLNVLGLEFNFDKLSPGLKSLLLRFGSLPKYRNRRSLEPRTE